MEVNCPQSSVWILSSSREVSSLRFNKWELMTCPWVWWCIGTEYTGYSRGDRGGEVVGVDCGVCMDLELLDTLSSVVSVPVRALSRFFFPRFSNTSSILRTTTLSFFRSDSTNCFIVSRTSLMLDFSPRQEVIMLASKILTFFLIADDAIFVCGVRMSSWELLKWTVLNRGDFLERHCVAQYPGLHGSSKIVQFVTRALNHQLSRPCRPDAWHLQVCNASTNSNNANTFFV